MYIYITKPIYIYMHILQYIYIYIYAYITKHILPQKLRKILRGGGPRPKWCCVKSLIHINIDISIIAIMNKLSRL